MNLSELNQMIVNLRANGLTDEQIQITFLLMYRNKKISYIELKLFLAKINCSINEEMDALSDDERIKLLDEMFKSLENQ